MDVASLTLIIAVLSQLGIMGGVALLLVGLIPRGKSLVWRLLFSIGGGMLGTASAVAGVYYFFVSLVINAIA